MPNVRDIAKAAGVSAAAVSYVLNNRPGKVSPETRTRVMTAMRELGYRPKPSSQQPRSVRTDNMGVIMMQRAVTTIRGGGFFPQVLDGILQANGERQIATLIFTFDQWSDVHSSVRSRLDGRCDGILLLAPPTQNDIVPVLHERGYPVVLVAGDSDLPGIVSVDVDDRAIALKAMEHLIELGHRKIAHLPGQMVFCHARNRLDAYKEALIAASLPFDPRLVLEGEYLSESGEERASKLMQLPERERPTAIFCGNDAIAIGAVNSLQSLGIRVPQDVSVIGIDDAFYDLTMNPPLTTVRLPLVDVGYRAAEVLLDLIYEKPAREQNLVPGWELIVRQSTTHGMISSQNLPIAGIRVSSGVSCIDLAVGK